MTDTTDILITIAIPFLVYLVIRAFFRGKAR
jgi:hypothetical protein